MSNTLARAELIAGPISIVPYLLFCIRALNSTLMFGFCSCNQSTPCNSSATSLVSPSSNRTTNFQEHCIPTCLFHHVSFYIGYFLFTSIQWDRNANPIFTFTYRSGWFLGLRPKASHLSMPRGEYREGELSFDLFWVDFGFRGFLPPAVV